MIQNIHRKYFEVWGNEEAQNVFLKAILTIVCVLLGIESVALVVLALRKPTLIAVGNDETKVLTVALPNDELLKKELRRVVSAYINAHYNWDSTTIEKAHAEASKYVGEKFQKTFQAANAEQIRFAKEKKLKEKIYISEIQTDIKALTARITMDRILIVEGLRATTPFILDISFEYGPRTPTNPEGVYIVSENIINQNGA